MNSYIYYVTYNITIRYNIKKKFYSYTKTLAFNSPAQTMNTPRPFYRVTKYT